jgi:hypothetical protein
VDRADRTPRGYNENALPTWNWRSYFSGLGNWQMTPKKLVIVSATIELATGLALIADPGLVVLVLLGTDLSGGGTALGRVAGVALLALGMACWPRADDATAQITWALFTYNFLVAIYLIYLRTDGGFVSYLLWPACVLHALLALLLARTLFTRLGAAKGSRLTVQ